MSKPKHKAHYPMSIGYAALPVGATFAIIAVIANYLDPRHSELDTQQ